MKDKHFFFSLIIIGTLASVMFFSPAKNIYAATYNNNLVDSATALRIETILKEMNELMTKKSEENRVKNLIGESSGERFVPFYSQVLDISDYKWKGVGCGVTGLAMLIDYYKPLVEVEALLRQGISGGAYDNNNGWSHAGLISVANQYGLSGQSVSLQNLSTELAFSSLDKVLETGPVMVSVDYSMTAQNTIPHLIVVTDIKDDIVYYNNPASLEGGETISVENFNQTWKKRYIEVRA